MSDRLPKIRTKNIWIPLMLAIVLIVGLIAGFYLNKYLGSKRDFATILERNDRLEEMIDIIHEKYVDSISSDSLYNDAIEGILSHLDPHTSYIPAKDFEAVNATLEGNFKGVGMEYQIVRDTPMVSMITLNSPAFFAGIETGDQLLKINDTVVAGVNVSKAELVRRVRKNPAPEVNITLYRPIEQRTITLKIKKGEVPVGSIDAAYMLDKETGYIKIKRFSANTYDEFLKSCTYLKESGMKKLIVDVRQNAGGYLEAATEIADEFINGNKLLVYTYGSKIGRENYNAYRNGIFETGRLMIMVDEASASASEILAGAVQDWDRGVIIGRNTYGKGLVQEQFEMGDGAAMRITVARYYTPVGRSIQRSYEDGRDKYFWEQQQNREGMDTMMRGPKFYTGENNRVVYGGGGIEPDVTVTRDEESYSPALAKIINDPRLDQFIYQYFLTHYKLFKSLQSFLDFDTRVYFDPVLTRALDVVGNEISPQYAMIVRIRPNEMKLLQNYIKASWARILYSNEGYYKVMNRSDKMLTDAQAIINGEEYSKIINGQRTKPAQ